MPGLIAVAIGSGGKRIPRTGSADESTTQAAVMTAPEESELYATEQTQI
jgi:hypothetical protein